MDNTNGDGALDGRRRTILFVDDDSDIRAMMALSLVRAGFRVLPADCEEDAVEVVRYGRVPPDAVLVELGVDVEEALETGRRVRRRAELGPAPVVVVPAKYDDRFDGRDVSAGENEYLCYYEDSAQPTALLSRLLIPATA